MRQLDPALLNVARQLPGAVAQSLQHQPIDTQVRILEVVETTTTYWDEHDVSLDPVQWATVVGTFVMALIPVHLELEIQERENAMFRLFRMHLTGLMGELGNGLR